MSMRRVMKFGKITEAEEGGIAIAFSEAGAMEIDR